MSTPMPFITTVLCPIDFSDQSQHALRWAFAMAARHRSRLVVLTAVDPLLAETARVRLHLDLGSAETAPALRDFVQATVPQGAAWAPAVHLDVRVGDATDVILDAAARERASLIVMGTHGLGGFRKLMLGSTTERVLRRTHTAVLAVPRENAQPIVFDPAGPRFELTRLLVATDLEDASAAALEWAVELAQRLAVQLVLAHVVAPLTVPSRWRSYAAEVDEERVRSARARLDELLRTLPDTVERKIVVPIGRPADSIALLAYERQAGLIVVGLTPHRGGGGPRPGSTAYRVASLAHVPVLVVPPPEGTPEG